MDGSGNVFVTGGSYGGLGTGYYDYATIKYNSSGVEQWVMRYNGPANSYDYATAIALDGSGNVFVTGYSAGSGTSFDYATIKYDASGNQQWVMRYNGPGNGIDYARAIAVDGSGNVFVTGGSYGGSGTSADYATIKYNSSGVQQWVMRYNGPGNSVDYGRAIAVDGSGNVFVTGYSTGSGTSDDYATIKYNSSGVQQWVMRYNGPGNSVDYGRAIAVDGSGNVFMTGESYGSGTSYDYATIKYNSSGVQQWVMRYHNYSSDYARAIAVDGSGNVFVTGFSDGSGTYYDYATVMYDANGNQVGSAARYTSPGYFSDQALSIATGPGGAVCVTGSAVNPGFSNDITTIKYLTLQPPEAPVLVSPANGSEDQPISDTLIWHKAERATSYDVTFAGNTYNTTDTFYLYNLDYFTIYTWNVTAKNAAGSTPSSNGPFSFTTIIEKPAPFILTTPKDDSLNAPIDIELTWESSARADSYLVYLGTDDPPTNIVSRQTGTTYSYSGLSHDQTYYWMIVAKNIGGETSSDIWNFTTIIEAPEPFVLVLPAEGANTQPLNGTLIWDPATRADSYYVYLNPYPIDPPTTLVSRQSKDIGTNYNYSVSLNEQVYCWQVVAWNIGGYTYSSVGHFMTGRLDVGVTEILEPSGVIDTMFEIPKASVENSGTLSATNFQVTFVIWDSATSGNTVYYQDDTTIAILNPNDPPLEIQFDTFDVPNNFEGRCYSLCYTKLTNDADRTNDTAYSKFAVQANPQGISNWTQRPSVPPGSQNRDVQHGGSMASDDVGDSIFLLKGNNTCEFYLFTPNSDGSGTWTPVEPIPELGRDNIPRTVKEGGTIAQINGKFYVTKGGNTREFWKYDPYAEGSKWTQLADVPAGAAGVHSGASSVGVIDNGISYIYLLKASETFEFYRYKISDDIWQPLAPAPGVVGEEFKKGSAITYDGADTIYALKGIFNKFYAYSVQYGTWMPKPDLPFGSNNKAAKGGADILYHNQKVYCIKGSNSQEFWVYKCDSTLWRQDSSVPLGPNRNRVQDGGGLAYSYRYRYLYLTKGMSLEFWSYGKLLNYTTGLTPHEVMNENAQSTENGIVINYELKALPNVCHDFARINYALPKPGNITLKLYDATGREIRILAEGNHEPGRYKLNLNTRTLAQGIYYLKYEAADFHDTKKLMILR